MNLSRLRYLVVCAVLLCLISFQAHSQADPSALNAELSALEAVRAIDELLGETKLEAMQAGRGSEFTDKINIAKSFVHAHNISEARKAYEAAVYTAWHRGEQEQLMERIMGILDKADPAHKTDSRPAGLDENYQATERGSTTVPAHPIPSDKYAAGAYIDSMLAFLYTDIIEDQNERIRLKGKLNDCRHLVEMELFTDAQDAYHDAIIAYLDPRWTSQLLQEISEVLHTIEPSTLDSEKAPHQRLSLEAVHTEVDELLRPVTNRYGGNAVLERGIDSLHHYIAEGNPDNAIHVFRSVLAEFTPTSWLDYNSGRLVNIMKRCDELFPPEAPPTSVDGTPILYFTDEMEGRVIERLRVLEDGELMTYKKVTHNWGGVFYFLNDEPTKDTEWLRVWRLYQTQVSDEQETGVAPE